MSTQYIHIPMSAYMSIVTGKNMPETPTLPKQNTPNSISDSVYNSGK